MGPQQTEIADGAALALPDGSEPPIELSIVIPVYGAAGCLDALVAAIDEALIREGQPYEIILVNDDSPDDSWAAIERLSRQHSNVIGIDLRRNFGQDNALLTGIRVAQGRYIATMDDDLQHDPRDLLRLRRALEPGFDVVYADFRKNRNKLWKRAGSWLNGKLAEWVLHKPKHIYLSPYKLFRREVAELICRHNGPEPYVDGLLFQVTSRIGTIPVDHQPRYAGRSTYTFSKSLLVWSRVAFSFSIKPLRIVTVFGAAFFAMGLLLAIAVILYRLLSPESFPPYAVGWASLAVAVLFFGGIQMVFFGILGEYAGRTFLRVNDQPQTAVRTIVGPRHAREFPESAENRAAAALANHFTGPVGGWPEERRRAGMSLTEPGSSAGIAASVPRV
jgi:undecaprenyl-phosphate 4-deoxy-4-formamido-L-arabinose transferase